jgi:hypothetical protein
MLREQVYKQLDGLIAFHKDIAESNAKRIDKHG